jgi:hypothetical protein
VRLLANRHVEPLALAAAELLRVVESRQLHESGEDDGRSHDRPGERADADLIDAGDSTHTLLEEPRSQGEEPLDPPALLPGRRDAPPETLRQVASSDASVRTQAIAEASKSDPIGLAGELQADLCERK